MTRRPAMQQVARRVRVPLGFAFAAVFLVFARPDATSLLLSLLLVVPGLLLRGYASGYVKKNRELATTGPYAYTRNPLYLGSLLLGLGFAGGSRNPWLFGLFVALFAVVYGPTIRSEERFLRGHFAGFDAYAAAVPRLLPRLRPARLARLGAEAGGGFDRALYLRHREYNASIGAAALYAALLLRLFVLQRPG